MIVTEQTDLIQTRFAARHLRRLQQRTRQNTFLGHRQSKKKGRGIEFSQARAYNYGDDIRHIDWRISARKLKTHTREYHQDDEHSVFIVVDQSSSMKFGSTHCLKSVQAALVAALVGWTYIDNRCRIGGLIHHDQHTMMRPAPSIKKFCHWLGKLSEASKRLVSESAPPTQILWSESLLRARQLMPTGSQLFLIGDLLLLDEPSWISLTNLSRYSQINAIHIYDALEKQLPPLREIALMDAKNNIVRYHSSPRNQSKNYEEIVQSLTQRFLSIGGQMMTFSTQNELSDVWQNNQWKLPT